MSSRVRIVYLHGFASGPGSRKARFFEAELKKSGLTISIPDLVPKDFEHLTITGQLKVIEKAVGGNKSILIGSSLGGYLAALHARTHPSVQRLLLLAPAFHFVHLWRNRLGEQRWKSWQSGQSLQVHHYALGQETDLSFELMRDAACYEPEPAFQQPALIFHGLRDDTVPVQQSLEYARRHKNVRLTTLDSGHELTDVLESIWHLSRNFLTESGKAFEMLD